MNSLAGRILLEFNHTLNRLNVTEVGCVFFSKELYVTFSQGFNNILVHCLSLKIGVVCNYCLSAVNRIRAKFVVSAPLLRQYLWTCLMCSIFSLLVLALAVAIKV